jgi:hypothetical protein
MSIIYAKSILMKGSILIRKWPTGVELVLTATAVVLLSICMLPSIRQGWLSDYHFLRVSFLHMYR